MVSEPTFLRPSRVLLVSIHRMWYPVSVETFHQVFSPYGKVEIIETHGSQAVIRFRWSLDAAVVSRCLQGRNIYDGCCQMNIHYSEWDVVEAEFEEKLDGLVEKLKSVQELPKFEDSPMAHQLFDEKSEQKLEVIEPQTEKSQISASENPPNMMKTSVAAVKTETMASFWKSWAAEMKEQNESIKQAFAALLEEGRRVMELQAATPVDEDEKPSSEEAEAVKENNTEAENEENKELIASDGRGVISSVRRMALALLVLQIGLHSPFGTPEAESPALAHLFTVNDKHKAMEKLIPTRTKEAVYVFDKMPSPASQEDILWNSTTDEYFRFGYLKEGIARSVMFVIPPAEKIVLVFDPGGGEDCGFLHSWGQE